MSASSNKEKALLVHVDLRDRAYRSDWPLEEVAGELRELAHSSRRLEVGDELTVRRDRPTPATLIGKGKGEELHARCHQQGVQVVVFGQDLSFPQQRNLEEVIGVKVIDRTQLILDIFAQRARSREGKVQVELAQLGYLLPRLAGKGVLLSRLGGGIGTRGPGEQKLEMDRRRIRQRISRLDRELEEIRQRRQIARRKREKEAVSSIALVGYTNAGKTTLLNALTHAQSAVGDQLFTTLDPLTRRLVLPDHQAVLLTDTVGFIHELPPHLVKAFRATLEEVTESDLLLHVLDASSPLMDHKASAVHTIVQLLEAEQKSTLLVLNKIDLVAAETRKAMARSYPEAIQVSAFTAEGLSLLFERLPSLLSHRFQEGLVRIPLGQEGWLDRIYREGRVLTRQEEGTALLLRARLPQRLYGQLLKAGLLLKDPHSTS